MEDQSSNPAFAGWRPLPQPQQEPQSAKWLIDRMEKEFLAAFENLAQYLGRGWTASDLARLASAYGKFQSASETLTFYSGAPK